ncbi:MAG: hypothetical protein JWP48_2318 [Actinoallomurus sp.]|jgi:hypothetical protein|nr:hypothetical protein [Actinoallomurus sp.]
MKLKPGSRLRSQVDATEVIVVRPPAGDVVVACGGHPMIDAHAEPQPGLTTVSGHDEGTQIGKRYTASGEHTFELLVTKPGTGGLSVDGVPAVLKEAKPLPASD